MNVELSSPRLAQARQALLALLVVSLFAGVLVPIYTDEVAWRIQLSRFVEDGWVDHAVGETCGANTIAVPPLFMWPVRLFSSGVTWLSVNPLTVRLAGIANALLMTFLFRSLINALVPAGPRRDAAKLFAYALLGLGTLPLLLIWSRPEQPMLLCLLLMLLILFRPRPGTQAGFRLRLAGLVLLASISLSYHLKTVFYLPAFAAMLLVAPAPAATRAWPSRGAAILALVMVGWTGGRYWSHRFGCPDDPLLAAKLAQQNISVTLLGQGWRGLGAAVPQMLRDLSPMAYILKASPIPHPMSDWLPELPVKLALLPWIGMCALCWLGVIVRGFIFARLALADPARNTPRLVVGAALFLCATGWAAFQINKNPYESAFLLPLLISSVLLVQAATERGFAFDPRIVTAIALTSVASQVLLLAVYVPVLWPTTRGGYLEQQRYSVSGFRYDEAAVIASGAKCGLAPRPGLGRVLVDDLTYFAYARTRWPLYRLGVVDQWNGSISDPYRWLQTHGSPGVVMACAYLPEAMRRRATATGAFCCLSTR